MSVKYFEMYSDLNLNTENFNSFILNTLSCTDNENIRLQKDINYFQNSFLISIFTEKEHYKIEKNDLREVKKISHIYGNHSLLISCDKDFNEYIKILFQGKNINLFTAGCNTLFFSMKDKNYKFLVDFLEKFNKEIIVKSKRNLSHYLNLKKLRLPDINLDSSEELIKKIYSSGEESDFYIGNEFSKENIERLNTSRQLKFPYIQGTIKEKFILLKSLIKISQTENLPTNTIKKIIKNISHYDYIETFNYYYYNLICKYEKLDNFRFKCFGSIDEAISYSIDLELKNIRGYMINFKNKIYICYQHKEEIGISNSIESNKSRVLNKLEKIISEEYILKQLSLKDLVNIQIINKKPVLESSENLIEDKEILPLELLLNKGNNMYNITGKLLDFSNKNYLSFNRKDFDLRKIIEINLIEKIDTYYSVIIKLENTYISLEEDFYIPEKEEDFKRGISKSINKGYLISDFGLVRYITTSELKTEDICIPEWFKSETEEQFLFLLNVFSSI